MQAQRIFTRSSRIIQHSYLPGLVVGGAVVVIVVVGATVVVTKRSKNLGMIYLRKKTRNQRTFCFYRDISALLLLAKYHGKNKKFIIVIFTHML